MAKYDQQTKAKIQEILKANANKPFVRRIQNPYIFPNIPMPEAEKRQFDSLASWGVDDRVSTHLMSTAGIDNGRAVAFPKIQQQPDGALQYYRNFQEGARNALQTRNAIAFPSEKDALWFTENYKSTWQK